MPNINLVNYQFLPPLFTIQASQRHQLLDYVTLDDRFSYFPNHCFTFTETRYTLWVIWLWSNRYYPTMKQHVIEMMHMLTTMSQRYLYHINWLLRWHSVALHINIFQWLEKFIYLLICYCQWVNIPTVMPIYKTIKVTIFFYLNVMTTNIYYYIMLHYTLQIPFLVS